MKEKILECAKKLYLENGYHNLSLRKIAKCAGISATAIYRHFDNKEDLMLEVLLSGFMLLKNDMLNAFVKAENSKERLLVSLDCYMKFALKYPHYYELMFMRGSSFDDYVRTRVDEYEQMRGTFFILADRIRECMDNGEVKKGDAVISAFKLFTYAHGMISLYVSKKIRSDQEKFEKHYIDSIAEFVEFL